MKRLRIVKYTSGVVLLLAVLILGGCGMTHKVLKSGDAGLIYDFALERYEVGDWNKAASLFEYISAYYEGTNRDDSVKFFKARSLYKGKNYQAAAQYLDEFRRQYSRSIFLEDAEGMYTLCYYFMAPGSTRDSGMITNAIMVINEFINRYPESAQMDVFVGLKEELISRLHDKSFANAYSYYKTGYYKSAIIAFKNALKEYPESVHREAISYYVVASAYELANKSIESKKEDRYLNMIDSYYTFISAYPESKYRESVDGMLQVANEYIDSKKAKKAREDEAHDAEKEADKAKKQEREEDPEQKLFDLLNLGI